MTLLGFEVTAWEVFGLAGQAAFFARFFVQWIASERAGKSVAPRIFWWLSVVATLVLAVYTLHLGEPVLLFGYVVNSAIYARNLWIDRSGRSTSRMGPIPSMIAAVLVWALLIFTSSSSLRPGYEDSSFWFFVVLAGQGLWSLRFLIQWWATERRGESHFPPSFWWISLMGNGLLLAYAVYLGNIVLVLGFLPGPLIQIRNLMLVHREQRVSRGAT